MTLEVTELVICRKLTVTEIGDVGRHRARESTKPARDIYTRGTGEIVHVHFKKVRRNI